MRCCCARVDEGDSKNANRHTSDTPAMRRATLSRRACARDHIGATSSILFNRCIGRLPGLPAAGHGEDVSVTHALQIVGGQRRAIAAATVEDEFRVVCGHALLYVALDDAA